MGTEPGPLRPSVGRLTAIVIGVVALAFLAAQLSGSSAEPTDPSATAELAPDFSVRLLDGTMFTLSEHLATDGRPVVLNFWASWCGPCRAEMPDFDVLAAEKPGLLVLGVAVQDSPENARDFAAEIGVSYPLAIDEAETVAAAYPFLGLPSTWFIGEDQTIRREVAGFMTLEQMREVTAGAFGF